VVADQALNGNESRLHPQSLPDRLLDHDLSLSPTVFAIVVLLRPSMTERGKGRKTAQLKPARTATPAGSSPAGRPRCGPPP
jgi:hypothetical protein